LKIKIINFQNFIFTDRKKKIEILFFIKIKCTIPQCIIYTLIDILKFLKQFSMAKLIRISYEEYPAEEPEYMLCVQTNVLYDLDMFRLSDGNVLCKIGVYDKTSDKIQYEESSVRAVNMQIGFRKCTAFRALRQAKEDAKTKFKACKTIEHDGQDYLLYPETNTVYSLEYYQVHRVFWKLGKYKTYKTKPGQFIVDDASAVKLHKKAEKELEVLNKYKTTMGITGRWYENDDDEDEDEFDCEW